MRVCFEDIVFWIAILAIIGIVLWMLYGSPTDSGAIIGIGAFVAMSEILIWKGLFKVESNAKMGFEKVRMDFRDVNLKLGGIEKQLNEIKVLLK